jgi:hypothetical protein
VLNLTVAMLAYMPIFTDSSRLLMLLPLVLSISIVHKALKQPKMSDLPLTVLALWATIVAGMIGLGIGLLVVYRLLT